MSSTTVMAARPATAPDGLVPRSRLLARLLGAPHVPLVLLVAPAGFGKTTLLEQWAARDPRPFERVTAGDADIAEALDGLEPPGVVVLDDAHLLPARELFETATTLLEELPPGSQLVLASRSEPGLPTGHLRAHRKLLEIRSPDLVMSGDEAAALFASAGLDLRPAEVATLVERTEGWPACLYLAALAVRDQPDTGRALSRFAGGDRLVADYLRDELLSKLPRRQLDFLIRTSVLDTLSGPLCDAVLERTDSARALDALARSTLLVVPLDRVGERFRYHRLLADTLRAELRRLEPAGEREVHLRASGWYADHGDFDRAISHAIAAGDVQRAGNLLWSHLSRYVLAGTNGKLDRWFGSLTDEQVEGVPELSLVAAVAQLAHGDGNRLRRWTSAATDGVRRLPPGNRASRLETPLVVLRGALGEEGMPAAGSRAAASSPLHPLACLIEGVEWQLNGDDEPARAALEEGVRRGAVGAPGIQTLCLSQLALLALEDDDVAHAEALVGRASAQAKRSGVAHHPAQALVFGVAALVHAASRRVTDAGRDLRQSQRLLAGLSDFIPWYEAEVRVVLARAFSRLGDVPRTRELSAEASRFLRGMPGCPVLHAWLDQARAQADAVSGSAGGDGCSLTTAELRVLQFLPSHLSFPEVAKRLCVSPNTVKTHARAVYRKLDACSRAEAVAHARRAGLVDDSSDSGDAARLPAT